jgi:hypothetical protein
MNYFSADTVKNTYIDTFDFLASLADSVCAFFGSLNGLGLRQQQQQQQAAAD